MKKLFFLFSLLASVTSFAQFSNYTNINGRYKWIAGKFDSTFTLPSGSTPSLRTGGGTGPGAMFYRTTDSTIYQYTGTQWIKLRGSISPSDTAGLWMTNVYRKPGSDSVFYVKGGTHTFAFRDSIGVGGGGGGGKIYYFNGGDSLGVFGGFTMYELGDTANTGAAANFTRSTTGNLANFITDPGRPGLLQIPAGVWTVDAYLSETGGGSNHAEIWIEVEKWDGSTITTIATSPIEQITNGSAIDLYTWSVSIPTTTLAVTDRIIIQFYITNTNGKTVTLYTQNGYVGEVHTTFTTGLGSLNGLTAASQYFATGTSGTDFAISSSTATHTFNLPTASATNRGALSSADWTTFNSKVGGSGTTNYLSKWTSSSALGNSLVFDNSTSVGINTATPSASFLLDVNGTARVQNNSGLSLLVGSNSSFTATATPVVLSLGGTFGTSAAGSSANVKLRIYDDGGSSTIYGIGISATLLEIHSNENIGFFNGSSVTRTERMRITTSGNVGIGTTSPSYKVDITGDLRNTTSAYFATNSGNVGIATTSPAARLHVASSDEGFRMSSAGGAIYSQYTNGTQQVIYGVSASLGVGITGTITNHPFIVRTNNTEIARFTAAGRLLIGTSTESTFLLDVSGTFRSTGAAYFATSSGAVGVGTTSPNASALLDVSSTTKGFLPPRMTNAQMVAITTPAAGLVVYDTTNNKLNVYDGTNWVAVH